MRKYCASPTAARSSETSLSVGYEGRAMRHVIITGAFGLAFGLWAGTAAVVGQTIPKSLQEGGPEEVLKQRQNNWTVGVAGGNMDGTYLRFADELGKVLDAGDAFRVLPTISPAPPPPPPTLPYPPRTHA